MNNIQLNTLPKPDRDVPPYALQIAALLNSHNPKNEYSYLSEQEFIREEWLGKKIIWPGEAENLKLENLSEKLVSVNINGRQYKKQSRGGSFCQKIETANSAQLR